MSHFRTNTLKPLIFFLCCITCTQVFSQDNSQVNLSTKNVVAAPGMNIYNIIPILDEQEKNHNEIVFFVVGNHVTMTPYLDLNTPHPRKLKNIEAWVVYNIKELRAKLAANGWTRIKFEIIEMNEDDVNRLLAKNPGLANAKNIIGKKTLVITQAKSGDAGASMVGIDAGARICPPPLNCNTTDPATD